MAVDTPISSRLEDELGRAPFAQSIAAALRRLDPAHGAVMGLFGPWGVGKTSLLNMVTEALTEAPPIVVLQFNPWLFSGPEQLVVRFFGELGSQLRLQPGPLRKLAGQVIDYGQAVGPLLFIPVAGPWLGRTAAVAGVLGRIRHPRTSVGGAGVYAQRLKLEKALGRLDSPIVVVIDDIDRLRPSDVRDVFQLVRLTGSFPNILYLLAFDRGRVERVLGDEAFDGRAYLEKIVEIAYDVPLIPDGTLSRILLDGLDQALDGVQVGPFDADRWVDVFHRGVRPLFSNLRDVKRYLATLPTSLGVLGDEIALVDALALEALRLFAPDSYAQLPRASVSLAEMRAPRTDADASAKIEALIQAADSGRLGGVKEMVSLLFPAAERHLGGSTVSPDSLGQWRRERRVANPFVLTYYLTHALGPDEVPARMVDLAFQALTDEVTLRALLSSLAADGLEDLLERLEAYEGDFPVEGVEPASGVLLELYPRLRRVDRGLFDVRADIKVARVLLRLLRRIDDQQSLTAIVERLCARPLPWYARLQLLDLVGHRAHVGQKLISETDAARIYGDVCDRICHAPAAELASERHVLTVLYRALEAKPSERADLDVALADPALFTSILVDSVQTVRAQTLGRLAVSRSEQLAWDVLCQVAGDEGRLVHLLDALEKAVGGTLDEKARMALDLARRYQAGWRPDRPVPVLPALVPRYGPSTLLSPAGPPHGWPDLLLRAAVDFEVSQGDVPKLEIDPEFRRRFQSTLQHGAAKDLLRELQERLGIVAPDSDWALDSVAYQSRAAAVMTLPESEGATASGVSLRCGVLLAEHGASRVRIVMDTCWRPSALEKGSRGQGVGEVPPRLSVGEVAHVLAVMLRFAGNTVPDKCLTELVGETYLERTSLELHMVAGNAGDPPIQLPLSLADSIDLAPLGQGRPQPPTEGHFATSGLTDTTGDYAPGDVVVAALRGMALDWGYVDPEGGLPAFGSVIG